MPTIWCMVPEIWGTTDIIICHSGPFFALLPPMDLENQNFGKWPTYLKISFSNVYHKTQSYDIWFLRYEVQRTGFLVIFDHFLLFYPPNNPKDQNFEKLKNIPGDIIILHMCTINGNHMIYSSWDLKRDRQNFFSFWTVFCKNFVKIKKTSGVSHKLHHVSHKLQSYDVWFLRY